MYLQPQTYASYCSLCGLLDVLHTSEFPCLCTPFVSAMVNMRVNVENIMIPMHEQKFSL